MLLGCLGITACSGGLSAENICRDGCAKQADCTGASHTMLEQCYVTCSDDTKNGSDAEQQIKDRCRNATTVLSGIEHCVTSYCNEGDVNDCVTTATQKCDPR